jgi:formate hydrogenlyase transcriptional activator
MGTNLAALETQQNDIVTISSSPLCDDVIGSSEELRKVLALATRVANSDANVLISGETGTGKELIAKAIHKRSSRASRPFVAINCGAIPQDLVASELFGNEKGAFTGAIQRRAGRFEMADGGTIFLDEVGELPLDTQVILLRVLQERAFERVGGGRPIPSNVRVLAATNRNLRRQTAMGAFRQDLFYRLNVFPIHLPPLRDRIGDIPILIDHLVRHYASRCGKQIRGVTGQSLRLLQSHSWPGNIRELQNVIERAVILCDDGKLSIEREWLAPDHVTEPSTPVDSGKWEIEPDRTEPITTTLLNSERSRIESALRVSRGVVAGSRGAAAQLGVPRTTLESRISALGIRKYAFKQPD